MGWYGQRTVGDADKTNLCVCGVGPYGITYVNIIKVVSPCRWNLSDLI